MKVKKIVLWALVVLVALALLVFHYKERRTYVCQSCFSTKSVYQWRLGVWMAFSFPITPKYEDIQESYFYNDFINDAHAHEWKFSRGSPYSFIGTGGCSVGIGVDQNKLARWYEEQGLLRSFIDDKVRTGAVTRERMIELFREPSWLTAQEEADPRHVVLQGEVKALLDEYNK